MGSYVAYLVSHDRKYALAVNKALDSILTEKRIPVEVQRKLIESLSEFLGSMSEGRH